MVAGARSATGEWVHPDSCRDRRLPLDEGLGWRLRIDPGVERFDDLRLGPQVQDPAAQGGDLLIRDRRGNWTYQFAVTVDDWRQSIDLVVRGTDLLDSTGRQIRLARMLGRETPPQFLHHALMMKTATQKLSKSDGDTGVRGPARARLEPGGRLARRAGFAGRGVVGEGLEASGFRLQASSRVRGSSGLENRASSAGPPTPVPGPGSRLLDRHLPHDRLGAQR